MKMPAQPLAVCWPPAALSRPTLPCLPAALQRQGGCNHMVCRGCGQHFCWVCGRAWSQHSPETGEGMRLFVSQQAGCIAGRAGHNPLLALQHSGREE